MSKNEQKLNDLLKLSWGHIFAAIAIIGLAYSSFCGTMYLFDGDFALSTSVTLAIVLVLIILFIVPQYLKGAESSRKNGFERMFAVETMLLILSLVCFIPICLPTAHFINVVEKADEPQGLISQFESSVKNTQGMFTKYEEYAEKRIEAYKQTLQTHNFANRYEADNRVEVLRIQLLADNYTNIKSNAETWINNSTAAPSAYNVFLIGNSKIITEAIGEWHVQLQDLSKHIMEYEREGNVSLFDADGQTIAEAKSGLLKMAKIYTEHNFAPNLYTFLLCIIALIFLYFPYFVQKRDGKSTQRMPWEHGIKTTKEPIKSQSTQQPIITGYEPFTLESIGLAK